MKYGWNARQRCDAENTLAHMMGITVSLAATLVQLTQVVAAHNKGEPAPQLIEEPTTEG